MREEDLKALDVSFEGLANADDCERAFRRALGVWLPRANDLFTAICDDLNCDTSGIGWWADHLDRRRRILIADHLVLCCNAVSQNVVEARWHLLELRDALGRRSREFSRRVTSAGRTTGIALALPLRATDDLAAVEAQVHFAGLLRAIASAFDCLAATIIGVAAVPVPIFKAEFKALNKNYLSKVRGDSPADVLHRQTAHALNDAIRVAGPEGWLEWTLDFRNMVSIAVAAPQCTKCTFSRRESLPWLVSQRQSILWIRAGHRAVRHPQHNDTFTHRETAAGCCGDRRVDASMGRRRLASDRLAEVFRDTRRVEGHEGPDSNSRRLQQAGCRGWLGGAVF